MRGLLAFLAVAVVYAGWAATTGFVAFLAAAVVTLDSVEAVHVDPDGAIIILSRNVRDVQIELPRLARSASISLRRVEPLDDSLESVFGYLVER